MKNCESCKLEWFYRDEVWGLLKVMQIACAIIVLCFSIYGLTTNNSNNHVYMFFFLGMMFLLWGGSEYMNRRKPIAIMLFLTSIFILFATVSTILV
ncbi:YczI family protein [Terribacillus halophilus]|jgi:uncharacterized protein with PQ loop repeat|uniref:YczI family protein n=1 Tax=Terribacillus halophilus TaxID=361279 RepID=UPI0009875609